MEILLEHTVNSLFPHHSGQNHFLLTSLYMLFRSSITHSPREPPPVTPASSLQLPATHTSTCRTEESASNSHCGRSQPQPFWVTACLHMEDLLWWQNPPLPHWASRLMECKVPFNISTGVRDRDTVAQRSSLNGKPHKIFHKSSSFFFQENGQYKI